MAQIIDTSFVPPVTPVKANTIVQSTELTPEYSPAPTYTKSIVQQDRLVDVQASSKSYGKIDLMPDNEHPVLPIGNMLIDIRNHLSCHSIFNKNVDTLLNRFLTMKNDLDASQATVARLEREVKKERSEKEGYKDEVQILTRALKETEAELDQTRSELSATQEKLRLSVIQLMDTAKRLEDVKTQLREAIRDRDEQRRKVKDKDMELEYCKKRITELEIALGLANKGENDANDRNVRLTHLLYEIEAQKATIERARDAAELRIRELQDQLQAGNGHLELLVAKLRAEIVLLEQKIARLESQYQDALRDIGARDETIGKRDETIARLELDIRDMTEMKEKYLKLVIKYSEAVKKLPKSREHKKCKELFKGILEKKPKRTGNVTLMTAEVDEAEGLYESESEDDEIETYESGTAEPKEPELKSDSSPVVGAPTVPEPATNGEPTVATTTDEPKPDNKVEAGEPNPDVKVEADEKTGY